MQPSGFFYFYYLAQLPLRLELRLLLNNGLFSLWHSAISELTLDNIMRLRNHVPCPDQFLND